MKVKGSNPGYLLKIFSTLKRKIWKKRNIIKFTVHMYADASKCSLKKAESTFLSVSGNLTKLDCAVGVYGMPTSFR